MRLWHVVVHVRIVRPIDRPDLPLSGHAAMEFFADLLTRDLLGFIRTGGEQNGAREKERGEDAFQALTL